MIIVVCTFWRTRHLNSLWGTPESLVAGQHTWLDTKRKVALDNEDFVRDDSGDNKKSRCIHMNVTGAGLAKGLESEARVLFPQPTVYK